MKIRVTMKTPDALNYAMKEAYPTTIPNYETDEFDPMDPESDKYNEAMDNRDNFKELCQKWFEYGEYVTLEIDTEAGTCVVVEQ